MATTTMTTVPLRRRGRGGGSGGRGGRGIEGGELKNGHPSLNWGRAQIQR